MSKPHGKPHSIGMAKKLRCLKTCPVTGGRPTAMTLSSFQTACGKCQESDKTGWGRQESYRNPWCDVCQGKKLPKELEILDLKKLERKRMADRYVKSREVLQHSPAR